MAAFLFYVPLALAFFAAAAFIDKYFVIGGF